MPDQFIARLAAFQRRFRLASAAVALLCAAAASGMALITASFFGVSAAGARIVALVTFAGIGATLGAIEWRRWTLHRVATAVESRVGNLDNLVVTAEEIASRRIRPPHRAVVAQVFALAGDRLTAIDTRSVQPLGRAVAVVGLAVISLVALFVFMPVATDTTVIPLQADTTPPDAPLAPGDVRVIVTPPAYMERKPVVLVNPTSIVAIEGSRVRLEIAMSGAGPALATDAGAAPMLRDLDGRETPFAVERSLATLELPATTSRPLLVRQRLGTGTDVDRLLNLRVDRDQRPTVAIREPAKDLMFPTGAGEVRLQIEARDDFALQSLALRYTRVSGSGETFTFEEGEWPVVIARTSAEAWRATASLSLDRLKLDDGDTLVYRAVARDGKPGADAAASDTYLIEIGRLAGVASTGFALPDERDRQAISQQMLIIKTERLHADRNKLAPEAFAEQAQLLAVEQRMVKAEFVFMTGGEVQDEIEEAASSHEHAEGRSENTGQVELLTAIREMSRAEARLNAADTSQALEFERAALKALQRAFDRRRYLLRTLPERARIDMSRRLTGELDTARSSTVPVDTPAGDQSIVQARELLVALGGTAHSQNLTMIATRLLALPASSPETQEAALALSAARDDATRREAVLKARTAIVKFLLAHSPRQESTPLTRSPITGRLVEELGRGGRQ